MDTLSIPGQKTIQLRNGDYLTVPGFTDVRLVGAGGCLTGDTWVSTPTGSKQLKDIQYDDEVLCYPEGDVNTYPVPGKVTFTHRHDAESTKDKLLIVMHDFGTLKITPQHYIATPQGDFAMANEFKVGDYFLLTDGKMSRIKSIVEVELTEDVYTIEVAPHATFIANGVRIHNGGGSKAKKPYKPRTDPVNLASNAMASVILLYSEGQTGGLIDGYKSVYFDETQLMSDTGVLQFQGVQITERVGLPVQDYVPGFERAANTISVNTEVLYGVPVVRAVTNASIHACRVVITIPRLGQLTDKGDRLGTSVSLQFDVRDPAVGDVWESRGSVTISGRTSEQYQASFRIDRPVTTVDEPWEIRVARLTNNAADPDKLYNQTIWSDRVEITDGVETYPNCAYVAIKIDSGLFGGKVPKISLGVKGILVKVPSNYDQTNMNAPRYVGVWDGTWKWGVTPNPVWHIYNFITNTRYGMKIDESYLNRYAFYSMARYCDAVDNSGNFVGVDDIAVGTKRRRFTINTQIMKQDDALALINAIASSARAITYYGSGTLIPVQDAPKDTAWRFGNVDVENGAFRYNMTQLKDRIDIANIRYNDRHDHWRPSIETYPDPSTHTGNERGVYNAWKYGCTSQAEARAFAKWAVVTSQNEYKMIDFTTGLNGALVRPGDVIEVYDKNVATVRFAGKILGGDAQSIQIDKEITIVSGATYTLAVLNDDGTVYDQRAVTNSPGATSTLTLDTALSSTPDKYRSWYLTGAGANEPEPTKWRVMNVKEDGVMKYNINGLFYDESKFTAVETGLSFSAPVYTKPVLKDVAPVDNVQFSVYSEMNATTRVATNTLVVTWTKSPTEYVLGYEVFYSYNNDQYRSLGTVQVPEIRIPNVFEGEHTVVVYAYNAVGNYSTGVSETYNYAIGANSIFLPPTNLYVYGTTSYAFSGPDLVVGWVANAGNNNLQGAIFKDYQVEIWTSDGATLLRREWTDLTYYNYDKTKNTQDGLHRSVLVKVYARDTNNLVSASPTSHVFTNAAPTAPVFDVVPGYGQAWVKITPPSDTDLAGYVVCMGTTSGFTPTTGNIVYSGPDNYCSFNVGTAATYYFKVAAYDLFDNTFGNLQFGSASSAVIFDASQLSQVTVEGITLKGNDPSSNQVSWTTGKVLYSLGGGSVTTYNITASNATWSSGTLYVFWDKDNAPTTLHTTTDIANTVGRDKRIIGIYRGSIDLVASLGQAFLDGSLIYAGTIAAAQLVTGTAVITQTAQIANAIIDGAHIKTATIDGANLKNATITSAQIGSLAVEEAHIQSLSVGTDKIKIDGVTKMASATTSGSVNCMSNSFTDIQSFVHSTTGNTKALFQFTFTMATNKSTGYSRSDLTYQILENSTVLKEETIILPSSNPFLMYDGSATPGENYKVYIAYGGMVNFLTVTNLSNNGSNTYTLRIKPYVPEGLDNFNRSVSQRTLILTEMKR